MAAKNALVTLRSGVTRAVLPNNITMVPGKYYLISLDDLRKLSRKVRETVLEVVNIGTSDAWIPRADNYYGYVNIAGESGGGSATDWAGGIYKYKPGQVVQGLNGSAFKLVKFVGDDYSAGQAMCWVDKEAGTVGMNGDGDFAGVSIADCDEDNYNFIQIEGVATVAGDLSVGDTASADGSAGVEAGTSSTDSNRLLGTVLSNDGAGSLEIALRNDKARGRHFKRPNLFLSSDF